MSGEALSSDDDLRERDILIYRVLEELESYYKKESWQAFWQVKFSGRSVAEVAKELNMTEGAVTRAIHRIKKRLKEKLGKLDEFEGFE